ncbi:MAG: hypothetical protein KAH25_01980, partial [Bacteroidales bacterium]|nr:hypothetical protein [Bacteroidales bacterium]
ITKMMMLALVAAMAFTACKKETKEDIPQVPVDKGYSEGALIANEGSFGGGNGSISYYDAEKDLIINNLFETVNNIPLGDVVQSVYRGVSGTYVCVNASNKIEVIDSKTFESVASIANIPLPRFSIEKDGKLYVSCWGNGGQIKVIDAIENKVIDSIMVGTGPEGLSIVGNNLYVANSGGFSVDSTISVINLTDNSVSTIEIDAYNPSSFVVDADNNIWVLAKGNAIYDANWQIIGHNPSKLFSLNTADNSIVKVIDLFSEKHPNKIDISKDLQTIYYGAGFGFNGIYKMDYKETTANATAFIEGDFYGFLINKGNDEVFALTAPFGANGTLIRYTSDGDVIKNYELGIFPNGGDSKGLHN